MMAASLVASQGHRGAGHALCGPGCHHPFFGPLHGELLDGCIQTLVSAGVPPSASAHQEAAVAVQVVIGAPPACRPATVASARLVPRVSALASFSRLVPPGRPRLVARVMAPSVLSCTPVSPASLATIVPSCAVVLPFGRCFQRMGLGKEALHGVDQMTDARGALAALFSAPTGGTLVLQGVEAIGMEGHLLLKLVCHVGGDAMHLPTMARRQAFFTRVKRMKRRVLAGVRSGKSPPTRVTVGVGVGVRVVPLQRQSLSRSSRRVIVAIAVTVVVVPARAVTLLGCAVAGASSATTGGMLGHATADMVPFHRRRGMVGRPGRKGALWA